jgi:hypothetical protein
MMIINNNKQLLIFDAFNWNCNIVMRFNRPVTQISIFYKVKIQCEKIKIIETPLGYGAITDLGYNT